MEVSLEYTGNPYTVFHRYIHYKRIFCEPPADLPKTGMADITSGAPGFYKTAIMG